MDLEFLKNFTQSKVFFLARAEVIKYFSLSCLAFFGIAAQAQSQRDLDSYKNSDKSGLNQFEAAKDTVSTFDGLYVRIGGASTLKARTACHEL